MSSCPQAYGGGAGLFETPDTFTMFKLTGLNVSRITQELEYVYNKSAFAHHEKVTSLKMKFNKNVICRGCQGGGSYMPGQ